LHLIGAPFRKEWAHLFSPIAGNHLLALKRGRIRESPEEARLVHLLGEPAPPSVSLAVFEEPDNGWAQNDDEQHRHEEQDHRNR
jgi:hypothetical protein